MRTLIAFSLALCFVMPSSRLIAHHSFAAEFDADKPFKITGTVTKVEWANPHAFFYLDVTDPQPGKTTSWEMELGSPNGLLRAGWNRNSLKVGDTVIVEGSRARDGSAFGNARVVILTSTGQRLFAASSQGQP
jgi:uncharacterized protein DUF6152